MFRFVMLELETARNIRESATILMNSITDTQCEQKAASSYLAQFWKNQNDAATGKVKAGNKYVRIQ